MSAKDLEKAEEQGLIEFFKLTAKMSTSNMICFDLEGKIKKYSSPEEILEDFYPVRLAHYQKRKVCITFTLSGMKVHVSVGLPRQSTANGARKVDEPSTLRTDDRQEGAFGLGS